MKINIVGRKVNLRDNFRNLVERKLSKFDRIFDEDAEATVTVTVEKNRQKVEIAIKQRGMIYRAEATELEMNDALDTVVNALTTQIRRHKNRLASSKKVKSGIDFGVFEEYIEIPDEEEDDDITVTKTKRFFVSVMTPDEAILQMNMLGHEFFMFRDDASGEVNVVYRRSNGEYGLLVPEK